MKILTLILTLVFLYFYGQFVWSMVQGGHHVVLLGCLLLTFAIGRLLSSDWEKEQDDKDIRAWAQKWRFRFSRIWPMKGEILPPNEALSPPQRKLPKSS